MTCGRGRQRERRERDGVVVGAGRDSGEGGGRSWQSPARRSRQFPRAAGVAGESVAARSVGSRGSQVGPKGSWGYSRPW